MTAKRVIIGLVVLMLIGAVITAALRLSGGLAILPVMLG